VLSPFGGLKKLFSPKNALKPFKAAHKAVQKVGGGVHKAVTKPFGGGGPKPPKPPVSRLAPKSANGGGPAVARKQKEMY
jgi:hypothetical protein